MSAVLEHKKSYSDYSEVKVTQMNRFRAWWVATQIVSILDTLPGAAEISEKPDDTRRPLIYRRKTVRLMADPCVGHVISNET